jgi:hypothetical protein
MPIPSRRSRLRIRYSLFMGDEQDFKSVLRATRPWWIVPILVLFGVALALVLTDIAPLRQFAYTVF